LQDMGGDFVIGFIQQMDAEKDPRNLLICFSCAQFISSNFSLGTFTEEMFEVLGCYFPIDFVPPPNDPHGITREDLVSGLRKCFAATSKFAEYCVPLLLEKMTSDLQSARLDCYLTLMECASVYSQKGLAPFLGSITSSIKREVLMNISADLVEEAKICITAVYKAVVSSPSQDKKSSSILEETIVELYQDIVKYLEGSDLKKSCLAYSLCRAVADSSPHTAAVVVPLVLPSLISSCEKHAQVPELLAYVRELINFLSVVHQHQTDSGVMSSMQASLTSALLLLEKLSAAASSDLQVEAVKGLTLIVTSGLAEDSQLKQQALVDKLVTKSVTEDHSELRTQLLLSLQTIVEGNSDLAQRALQSVIQQSSKGAFKLAVDALVHTVVDAESFTQVNKFVLETLQHNLSAEAEKSEHLLSCAGGVKSLLQRVSHKPVFTQIETLTALPVVSLAVNACQRWKQTDRATAEALIVCFREAFAVLGESMEKSAVTSLWDKLSLFYLEGNIQGLGLSGDFRELRPLNPGSPWQQTQLVAILEGLLTSADIQAMIERREEIFESAYVLALNTEDEFTHISACRCVAAIMNKAPIGSQIQWFLEPILDKLKRTMTPENSLPIRLRAVHLWLWLTKAMECRGHSATAILSSHLVTLLDDPDLGSEVGRSIATVVQDMRDVFSARLHSNVTPLYKQRFFSLNLKALLTGYSRASSNEIKRNYLLAVSGIVSELPLPVTKPHLASLMPLLLLALRDRESPNLSSLLSTLSAAAVTVPQAVRDNLDSLVPQLLDLSINFCSMKVRISALMCLEQLTQLPSHTLVPNQAQVVRELRKALDDKKRLVRKQATETRSAWILLQLEKL
ncbi:mms19 nucleotide excision repair protein homolog, partial [Plakobranchus ocellatus]